MTATTSLSDYYSNFILICKRKKKKSKLKLIYQILCLSFLWRLVEVNYVGVHRRSHYYFKCVLRENCFCFILVGLTLKKKKKKSIYNFLAETIIWNLMIWGILLWRFERHKAPNLESIELIAVLHLTTTFLQYTWYWRGETSII